MLSQHVKVRIRRNKLKRSLTYKRAKAKREAILKDRVQSPDERPLMETDPDYRRYVMKVLRERNRVRKRKARQPRFSMPIFVRQQ
ncbi:hypothetical protein [Burkholderia phage FLC9]|nr:hypothetical protein [Burkholderia phage FLC9]